jgi:CheY-like chemotaxis protein
MTPQTTSTQSPRTKQLLFVDDDKEFLIGIREVFSEQSRGSWEIHTAENHAQALGLLQRRRMNVIVLDFEMPVMDGLQFLRLLGRTHPGQQVVVWTGRPTETNRKACLEAGASLFLEKLISPDGFAAVFAALDALAAAGPQEGFRGMMRRVGLHEVLQLECLGRKSSVLEVFTGDVHGRIFIADGAIVHADNGALQGEVALYGLLGLRGGEFNLQPFSEPSRRSISGHYEFLLMEAARLSDERGDAPVGLLGGSLAEAEGPPDQPPARPTASADSAPVRLEETVLCSGSGEVLYQQGCQDLEGRLALLNQVEQQSVQLGTLLRSGRFDRLEITLAGGRAVCQVQSHMRLLVRSANLEAAGL